jgi:hypothetical protein
VFWRPLELRLSQMSRRLAVPSLSITTAAGEDGKSATAATSARDERSKLSRWCEPVL